MLVMVLGFKPQASHRLGRYSAIDLYPQSSLPIIYIGGRKDDHRDSDCKAFCMKYRDQGTRHIGGIRDKNNDS